MTANPGSYLKGIWRIYFGNAATVKDYRTQLRGNKAVWLWGGYLVTLLIVTLFVYQSVFREERQAVTVIQSQLRSFYQSTLWLLASVVTLVAPALTASTIALERQRQSLDLIFSAPVKPKYLLVGKMVSSFRYVWMLLILALPVTAVCVVMGGATWGDVLSAYLLLSSHAIIFTAIGIMMSAVAPTPVTAIIYTYCGVGLYTVFGSIASANAANPISFTTGATGEAPWSIGLGQFLVFDAAPTYTTAFGVQVPNWVFVLVAALLISKLLLLGAASSMNTYGGPDTRSLRIHGLIYLFLLSFGVGYGYIISTIRRIATAPPPGAFVSPGTTVPTPATPSTVTLTGFEIGILGIVLVLLLSLLIPNLVSFSRDAAHKFRPDGVFSLKAAIEGTPAGTLPYLLLMSAAVFGGIAAAVKYANATADWGMYIGLAAWATSYLVFWWAAGRLISSFPLSLKTARLLVLATMFLLLGLPLPILSAISFGAGDSSIYRLYMLYPMSSVVAANEAVIYAVATGVFALILLIIAERNLQLRTQRYTI